MQKQCPICKVPVEPGLDGCCTGCGVALDDVLESVDLETAAMSFDAACASCGGLLMGATDACPLCGVALLPPASVEEPAAAVPGDTFVAETFVPVPAEPGDTFVPPVESLVTPTDGFAEPGDTFVPPLESLVTPTDVTADTVVSNFGIPAEPPSLPDVETLGAPRPATVEDQELWSGLPVSWEKQPGGPNGADAQEPAPVEAPAAEVVSLDDLAPAEVAPLVARVEPDPVDGEAPLYVGAVAAPPMVAPASPPAPASAPPSAPPWQPTPKKDAPLELAETRTPRKTSWEQRWERAEDSAGTRPPRRVERRWVAAGLLFVGLLAAGAVGAAQLGLLGPPPDEVAANTPTPEVSATGIAVATEASPASTSRPVGSATPKPASTALAIATAPKATGTPFAATPTPAPSVVVTATATVAATPKPTATALAVAATPTPTPIPPKPTPTPMPTATPPKPTPTPTRVAIATPPPATPVATSAPVTAGDSHAAAVQRGQALIQQGNIDEAVREFKKLVKDDDGFPDGHYHLGSAYAYQGEFNKACTELRRYLKMAPQGAYAASARASLANCP